MSMKSRITQTLKTWIQTPHLGCIEYLINGKGYATTIVIVLERMHHFVERIAGKKIGRFEVEVICRDLDGKTIRQATIQAPQAAKFVRVDSGEILGKDVVVEGSVQFRVHIFAPDGRSLDGDAISRGALPEAYILVTDRRHTCTVNHANFYTADVNWVGHLLYRLRRNLRKTGSAPRLLAGAVAAVWNAERRTSIVLHCLRYRWDPVELEIRNSRGEALQGRIPPLHPYETRVVPLVEIFPAVEKFLGREIGNVILKTFPDDILNYRFMTKTVQLSNGSFGMDHSYQVSPWPLGRISAESREQLGKGILFPHSLIMSPKLTTQLVVYNCEAEDFPKSIGLIVYEKSGRLVCHVERAAVVPPKGFATIKFVDFLPSELVDNFEGHFETYYSQPSLPDGGFSTGMHGQVVYQNANNIESTQEGGGTPWHSPKGFVIPKGVVSPQSIYISVPFFGDDDLDTRLYVSNVSHSWKYNETLEFGCVLYDENGREVTTKEIRLGPNASYSESLSTLFEQVPKSGASAVLIRPKDPALGQSPLHYFVESKRTGTITTDHASGLMV